MGRMTGWPTRGGIAGLALLLLLVNGFGEETGWRGFALPHLEQRFGAATATLVLAALSAGWHAPMFFLSDGLVLSPVLLPGFLLGMVAGAFVLTWLYNRTGGSMLMVALGTRPTTWWRRRTRHRACRRRP